MAGLQQAPHLHLAELTASQFLDVWRHFDSDGNGYIEGKELENFFQELEGARKGVGVDSKNDILGDKMKEFMHKYDRNADGKIEMAEVRGAGPMAHGALMSPSHLMLVTSPMLVPPQCLYPPQCSCPLRCLCSPQLAQILPMEENFLLCFRQHVGSSSEFMEGFLSDLLKKANRPYNEPKLQEYTQTILRMFDMNGDGKLGLSEMSRLLPVQENFLLKFQGVKLSLEEFNAIFAFYDKDGSGFIDENELDALLKDLYEKNKKEMSIQQLTSYRKSIMNLSDAGKLYRKELEIVLCSEPPV
uniref:Uncharacterized protein n=1 Tax=Melopsittacus undulatus TaxID=13146 RepID=A0A8C6JYK3_MELUD